ncbi:hypothetical protein Trydic_g2539 [Trypoxylus dichotomus]
MLSSGECINIKYQKGVSQSPKRTREFRKRCPGIPKAPRLILARWGRCFKMAFRYSEYFQKISDETSTVMESQTRFQDTYVETGLRTIRNNYKGLFDAVEKL